MGKGQCTEENLDALAALGSALHVLAHLYELLKNAVSFFFFNKKINLIFKIEFLKIKTIQLRNIKFY